MYHRVHTGLHGYNILCDLFEYITFYQWDVSRVINVFYVIYMELIHKNSDLRVYIVK